MREGFGVGGVVDTSQALAMQRTDSANTSWLKAYVARWGWPTSARVDERRRNMGLPPLAEYLRLIDSVFKSR